MGFGALRSIIRPVTRVLLPVSHYSQATFFTTPAPELRRLFGPLGRNLPWIPPSSAFHSLTCVKCVPGEPILPNQPNEGSVKRRNEKKRIKQHRAFIMGVLLLNAVLTVRQHQANCHAKKGWEQFTDAVIGAISQKKGGVVFLLWGNYAQAKSRLIDETKHYVLKSAHPSGLSANRGFFGCRHFSRTNQILEKMGISPIDWQL